MMLIVLAATAAGIALIGMAAWWVAIPPVAMLGGYLLLLREVLEFLYSRQARVAA